MKPIRYITVFLFINCFLIGQTQAVDFLDADLDNAKDKPMSFADQPKEPNVSSDRPIIPYSHLPDAHKWAALYYDCTQTLKNLENQYKECLDIQKEWILKYFDVRYSSAVSTHTAKIQGQLILCQHQYKIFQEFMKEIILQEDTLKASTFNYERFAFFIDHSNLKKNVQIFEELVQSFRKDIEVFIFNTETTQNNMKNLMIATIVITTSVCIFFYKMALK